MKQTAVEWLENEFQEMCKDFGGLHTDFIERFKQAKAMEKEQIENSFDNGWKRANETKDKFYTTAEDYGFNYYNKTFKSE